MEAIRVCDASDLQDLLNFGEAYATGDRFVVTESGGTNPRTARTKAQAEKIRYEEDGARNEEQAWCDGSGGGITPITAEIMLRLTGSSPFDPSLHNRHALRGLALAILAATK